MSKLWEIDNIIRLNGLNGHECENTLGDTEGQEACVLQSMGSQRVGYNLVTEQQ